MKYFIVIVLFVGSLTSAASQTYEIGGFVGGANYIGDVGNTTYISPNTLAVGVLFKWNRSERHAFRASIKRATLEGNDKDASDSRRNNRGYSFKNSITELSVGLEYTFWEFNMYGGKRANTPYLYTGLTYFLQDDLLKNNNDVIVKDGSKGNIAIPMVLGYKASISTNLVLGFEVGARYSFTDNLDGSNPKDIEGSENLRFGNINNNDWYVFSGLTLTFTFGRQPCYCNF